jgi:hypothetical protein
MGDLTRLLEYKYASEDKRRSLLAKNNYSDVHKKFLLKGNEADVNELVIEEVTKTVTFGANSRAIFRNILATEYNVITYKFKNSFDIGVDDYAFKVSELGEIPVKSSKISGNTHTFCKYGCAGNVTREMIDDCHFSAIELEVKSLGAKLENTLNQQVLGALLDGGSATYDVDPAGSKIKTYDVGVAYQKLRDNQYGRSATCVLSPTALYWVTSGNSNFLDWAKLTGVNVVVVDDATHSDATSFWDSTDSANHYQGMIFDSDLYSKLFIRRDITVRSENNWRTLEGGFQTLYATMRFKTVAQHNKAISRILTK